MALDRNDIFAKVCDIASDVLGVEADELSEATTFDDLDANSLDRLQLVTAMEDDALAAELLEISDVSSDVADDEE